MSEYTLFQGEQAAIHAVRKIIAENGGTEYEATLCADLAALAIVGKLTVWPGSYWFFKPLVTRALERFMLDGYITAVPE